jgi:hypothetical protein
MTVVVDINLYYIAVCHVSRQGHSQPTRTQLSAPLLCTFILVLPKMLLLSSHHYHHVLHTLYDSPDFTLSVYLPSSFAGIQEYHRKRPSFSSTIPRPYHLRIPGFYSHCTSKATSLVRPAWHKPCHINKVPMARHDCGCTQPGFTNHWF